MNRLNWAASTVGMCWRDRFTNGCLVAVYLFVTLAEWSKGFNFINGIYSQADFVRCGLRKCSAHDKWLTKRFNLWHILSAKTHIITMGLMFCILSNNFSLMLIEQRHYHRKICYLIHLTTYLWLLAKMKVLFIFNNLTEMIWILFWCPYRHRLRYLRNTEY